MLKQYTLRMPGAVFGGENSLDNLTNLVKDTAKVAVFTDKGIEATGLADLVTAKIGQAGKEYVVFDELPAEPSYQQAQAAIDAFKASGADFIVAVGGGSVMDIAKLASLLKTDEYGVKELLDTPLRAHKCVPTLMIPTTAGTGAEATPNAIVAVPEKEVKIGIVNPEMIADYVILDPIMIKKLPRKIAASTGVDALCHAIECWTSNKANAFSDMYAMWALDLILNNMEFYEYPDGSGYEGRFTRCGICVLMKELGLYDLTPALCHLDYTMSEAGGVTNFVRQYTLASGGPYCDCGYKKKG